MRGYRGQVEQWCSWLLNPPHRFAARGDIDDDWEETVPCPDPEIASLGQLSAHHLRRTHCLDRSSALSPADRVSSTDPLLQVTYPPSRPQCAQRATGATLNVECGS